MRETAERVGYRPNRAGVRLRTGKTNVIALVRSTEDDVMNHTSQMINAIATALRGTSYHMILMPFFPSEDPMTPIRYIVETGSADGIIINQTTPEDPRVRYMHDRGVPFATHGRTDMGVDHPYFDFDNEAFARLMVREMAARGRRRLLLVAPPKGQSYARHMMQGFRRRGRRPWIDRRDHRRGDQRQPPCPGRGLCRTHIRYHAAPRRRDSGIGHVLHGHGDGRRGPRAGAGA